jgi:hypothetical protein
MNQESEESYLLSNSDSGKVVNLVTAALGAPSRQKREENKDKGLTKDSFISPIQETCEYNKFDCVTSAFVVPKLFIEECMKARNDPLAASVASSNDDGAVMESESEATVFGKVTPCASGAKLMALSEFCELLPSADQFSALDDNELLEYLDEGSPILQQVSV